MKKCDFGMPSLLEYPSIMENAIACKSLDFQFVELNMNLPHFQSNKIEEAQLINAKQQHGVYFTLHLEENCNPFDFNPYVSNAYLQTVIEAIALAKRHQMPIINMHMVEGIHFKLPNQITYLYEQYLDVYLEKICIFRNLCAKEINRSAIHICIENCNGFHPFMQRGIALLLESDCFGLTLDVGHSHCANDIDNLFMIQKQDRLLHMHLHDANGQTCHLTFGSGMLDIKEKMRLAKEHGCRIVWEVKSMQGLLASKKWYSENCPLPESMNSMPKVSTETIRRGTHGNR